MRKDIPSTQQGFTLIELLITIAIVGILAAIAIPSYLSYSEKAKFSEVILATSPYKSGVDLCAQQNSGTLTSCDNGSGGVPAAPSAAGYVASVTTADGVITATSQNLNTNYTYILTPTWANNKLTWAQSGTCTAAAIC